jgi:tRNA pseudouridine38-40 synthase
MKMQRFKCIISYDGTNFSGYQVQPNKRTVQGELESALKKLHKGNEVKVFASGRTDAGVHARGQVIHFDSPLSIPEDRWAIALNSLLPDDLAILTVESVSSSFHARFNAKGKEYRYYLHLSKVRDPFTRNYASLHPYPLDVEAMKSGAGYFLGTHDFTSFCSAKTEVEDKVRTIRTVNFFLERDQLCIQFVGDGFLYNMVRILVGTLLEIGSGERHPEDLQEILAGKDRSLAGKTAPGNGLFLWKVFY